MKKIIFNHFAAVVFMFTALFLDGCAEDKTIVEFSNEAVYAADTSETGTYEDDQIADVQDIIQDSSPAVVYVCGAVNSPGVYSLEPSSRIVDALNAAGGMSADADACYLNQALPIVDGMKIYVPTCEETADNGEGLLASDTNDPYSYGEDKAANTGVNINTASKEQLTTLPGIGEHRAELIIEYRNTHGGFKTREDIKNVQGIKDGIYEKIKDSISI